MVLLKGQGTFEINGISQCLSVCVCVKYVKVYSECEAPIAQLKTEACWLSQQVLCQEGSGQNVTESVLPCRKESFGNNIHHLLSVYACA